jgi:hypothetical protein
MRLWNEFTLNWHKFEAYLPTNSSEKSWRLQVTNLEGKVVAERSIPMDYAPVFGPDVADVAELDKQIEVVIKELELE